MKYSFAIIPALAASVAAQSAALAAISSIQADTDKLATAVAGYKASDCSASNPSLTSDSAALVSAINAGDSAVKAAGTIATADALNLAGPVSTLAAHVNSAINAAISAKPMLVSGGLGPAVYSALSSQSVAAIKFSNDLSGEVPAGLQGVASQLAAPISSDLSRGVAAFADATSSPTACGAAGSSGPSSTAGPSSSSAATTGASSSAGSSSAAASSSAPAVVGGGAGSSNGTATSTSASSSSKTSPSQSTGSVITGGAAQVAVSGGAGALALLAVLAL